MAFLNLHMHQIESFLTVAESRSFSAAADRLFISHTALTQQMNALEKGLGFSLFVRSPRGVVLTEAGEQFYEKIVPLIGEADELIQRCRDINENNRSVRVANINDLYTFYLYSKFYQKFQLSHPEIAIDFVPVDGREQTRLCEKGVIDVGFCYGTGQPAGDGILSSRIPVMGNITIIVSQDNPLARKDSVSIEDIKGETLYVSVSNLVSSLYDQFAECTIVPFELTMQNIYEKTKKGDLIVSPGQFAPLFPNLRYLPLVPYLSYDYYVIYRKDAGRAVKTLVNAYLDYVM